MKTSFERIVPGLENKLSYYRQTCKTRQVSAIKLFRVFSRPWTVLEVFYKMCKMFYTPLAVGAVSVSGSLCLGDDT